MALWARTNPREPMKEVTCLEESHLLFVLFGAAPFVPPGALFRGHTSRVIIEPSSISTVLATPSLSRLLQAVRRFAKT